MPTQLNDTRKYAAMTVADADALFLEIARKKALLDKETAAHKAKLAEMEQTHKDKVAVPMAELDALKSELSAYIAAHPERFVSPRKHKVGQIGTYGVTTDPAFVEITDAEALIQFAHENGYFDLLRVSEVIVKDAAAVRISSGEILPGANLIPAGDVAKLTFAKGYAEQLGD